MCLQKRLRKKLSKTTNCLTRGANEIKAYQSVLEFEETEEIKEVKTRNVNFQEEGMLFGSNRANEKARWSPDDNN